MRAASMPGRGLAWILLALASFGIGGAPSFAQDGVQTERWYELERTGQKIGYFQVVWAPSTWEGRKTVHDTTIQIQSSVRNMLGQRDRFGSTLTIDIERGADGVLWWQRTRVEEAGRVIVEELTWTGKGYKHVARLGDEERVLEIALDEPVMTDAESFLSVRARKGELEAGQTFDLRTIDVRGRRARLQKLRVVGNEAIQDESGEAVSCVKILERDPESGSETTLWLDKQGALVKLTTDGGISIARTTQEAAEQMPVKPAENRITTPSNPPLERVFSADRQWLDVHLQGDETRKLPEFPDSPWSRAVEVKGSDAEGWIISTVLTKYDDLEAKGTLPVTDAKFERQLEPTVLMQSHHPRLKEVVASVIGEEKDARTAAYLLARFVYELLDKHSPQVAQASALQILDEECGDCSEHALLYVALCRAAGIPARRCSGYVCIGRDWGAHAWAEIWVGRWIGADPTTGEVGTAARYLFFGYSDEPDSYPGVVSARASGRMRFVTTRIQEGAQTYDLVDPDEYRIHDRANARFVHVLAGIEARGVPEDWNVNVSRQNQLEIRGPGLDARLSAWADQGSNMELLVRRLRGGVQTTFGGAPAIVQGAGEKRFYMIHSRRRIVRLQILEGTTALIARLERVLAPTFADVPPPWPPEDEDEKKAGEEKKDEEQDGDD